MSTATPEREWWWEEAQIAERDACHVAGIALHLLGALPDPEIKNAYGYNMTAGAREAARAAGIVVPGTYGYGGPEDETQLAARVTVARTLLSEALERTPDDDDVGRVLLVIARDAIAPLMAADDEAIMARTE